jgi:hypothetical protein
LLVSKKGRQFPTKKIFRGRRNGRNNRFVPAEFRLFCGTENSRNSVPNHSAEEKKARNSVPWNKIEANSRNSVSSHSAEKKTNPEFSSEACLRQKHAANYVCWCRIFCKPNFFLSFLSVPSFGIDSSGKPRNASERTLSSAE